jgi:hypothetical protein
MVLVLELVEQVADGRAVDSRGTVSMLDRLHLNYTELVPLHSTSSPAYSALELWRFSLHH